MRAKTSGVLIITSGYELDGGFEPVFPRLDLRAIVAIPTDQFRQAVITLSTAHPSAVPVMEISSSRIGEITPAARAAVGL